MALKKPAPRAQVLDTTEAKEFVRAAASVDIPMSDGRPKKNDEHARVTLLLPHSLLSEIDQVLEGTGTPRLVWIRQAILAALKAEKVEKVPVPENTTWQHKP